MWENVGWKNQEKIERLQIWICNHPQVVNPPLKNDHIDIKGNITGKVTKTQHLHIQILIRELHNELIKTPPEGVFNGEIYESGDLIIGY